MVDDWGDSCPDPIKVESLPEERLSDLSFMVAGSGDGRHSFASVIGLGRAYSRLTAMKKLQLKAHLTSLDRHYASISKMLIICVLIDTLVDQAYTLKDEDRLEVQTTLFYSYVGWVLPSYCEKRLMSAIHSLITGLAQSPHKLPEWIHLNQAAVQPVLRTLRFWYTDKTMKTSKFLKACPHKSAADFLSMLAAMSGRPMPDLPGKNMPELNDEETFYKATGCFVAPRALWAKHHPGFQAFLNMESRSGQEALQKAAAHVKTDWKTNMTLIMNEGRKSLTHSMDHFCLVRNIVKFNRSRNITPSRTLLKESPAFAEVSAFFDAVVEAIKDMGSAFRFEVHLGEMNHTLSQMALGVDERPSNFPRKFTRIWLSNIPDFTNGTLNTAVYVLPTLQAVPEASASANCMWNTTVWKSDDDYCYNYTLLVPKELKKFLAVRTIRGDAVMGLLTLGASPLPRPLSELASRDELQSWLTRLLLYTLLNPVNKPRPDTILLPNTLVAFVELLVQLRRIGYPAHWLGNFLQVVLDDNLVTDRSIPVGPLPIPLSDRVAKVAARRVRLDGWLAELEAIVALSLHGLPFALQIPKGMASKAREIGLWKAPIQHGISYEMRMHPTHDPVVSLLFYNPSALGEFNGRRMITRLHNILDGNAQTPQAGSFYVYTSQDYVNFDESREIRFWMSIERVKKMKREKWMVMVWRTDFWMDLSEPSPASSWEQLSM
ncbi:hypothetical protein HGRIS_007032 [Hohenbuehelia grisea]